jgi:hypothetical protein
VRHQKVQRAQLPISVTARIKDSYVENGTPNFELLARRYAPCLSSLCHRKTPGVSWSVV